MTTVPGAVPGGRDGDSGAAAQVHDGHAIGLIRTALGVTLIVAFSLGPAAVLVGPGLLLVSSGPALSRSAGPRVATIPARVPLLSALVIAGLGCAMTVTGLTGISG